LSKKSIVRMHKYISIALFAVLLTGCGHDYEGSTLDLSYYQWNFWPDKEASWSEEFVDISRLPSTSLEAHKPTCGWDVLHRGIGQLVRIPATIQDHFKGEEGEEFGVTEDYAGVSWFHVRFTLPELWAGKNIELKVEGVRESMEIFLNEIPVGAYGIPSSPYRLDISEQVYYTRDNHLAIRIIDPVGRTGGITGNVILEAISTSAEQEEASE
jgi:hypothetical protein